jgi:hypothetical protein
LESEQDGRHSDQGREARIWDCPTRTPFRCGSLPLTEHSAHTERSIAAIEICNSYAPALPARIGKRRSVVVYNGLFPYPVFRIRFRIHDVKKELKGRKNTRKKIISPKKVFKKPI